MKTEFHGEGYRDADDDLDFFHSRTVKQRETTAALFINVTKYRGVAQITGVAGRIELDRDGLTELIDELTEARDFIERHPPRKRDRQ